MKLKLLIIAIIGYFLFSVTYLKAQSDTTRLTASHLAAARELMSTTGMTDIRFTLMRNTTIKTGSASVPEKNREKFISDIKIFFDKYLPLDRYKDRIVEMYAEIFTEDELKQLTIFYKSPLGKKITGKLPELMQNAMLMDQQILVKHNDEIQSIINNSVKER